MCCIFVPLLTSCVWFGGDNGSTSRNRGHEQGEDKQQLIPGPLSRTRGLVTKAANHEYPPPPSRAVSLVFCSFYQAPVRGVLRV